jgi:hypothetical protein
MNWLRTPEDNYENVEDYGIEEAGYDDYEGGYDEDTYDEGYNREYDGRQIAPAPCRFLRPPCRFFRPPCRFFRPPCRFFRPPCRFFRPVPPVCRFFRPTRDAGDGYANEIVDYGNDGNYQLDETGYDGENRHCRRLRPSCRRLRPFFGCRRLRPGFFGCRFLGFGNFSPDDFSPEDFFDSPEDFFDFSPDNS